MHWRRMGALAASLEPATFLSESEVARMAPPCGQAPHLRQRRAERARDRNADGTSPAARRVPAAPRAVWTGCVALRDVAEDTGARAVQRGVRKADDTPPQRADQRPQRRVHRRHRRRRRMVTRYMNSNRR